jgi:hypothetical protein
MPEIRDYVVTQTREVRVRANSAADACSLANAAFVHGQNSDNAIQMNMGPTGVYGNTVSRIRTIGLMAVELGV